MDSRLSAVPPNALAEIVDNRGARHAVSSTELTNMFLDRIALYNGMLNAVWEEFADSALREAARADRARARGRRLPLDGLPMVIKDNIDIGGHATSLGAGPAIAQHPERDAAAVDAIRRAGVVVLGKAAMYELAFGATSDNEHFGAVRNPWSLDRMAGGSSGGSGAAIAADLCIAALGTDSGGSIRIPAALCGVVGLRPTFGTVSTRGSHATSRSLDTVGPLARSAADVGDVLASLLGRPFETLPPNAVDVRVGIARAEFFEEIDPGVADAVSEALDVLRSVGAEVVDIAVEGAEAARVACSTVMHVEAFAEHEIRLTEHPSAYGAAVRRRLDVGRTTTATDYARALHARAGWRRDVLTLFDRVDVIATPTVPSVAPRINGADMVSTSAALNRFTLPWSFAGAPAVSVPCGFSDGLPVGLQLIARPTEDQRLLAVAAAYQSVTDYHRRRSPAFTEAP
jgi:aspartyl-tRNA(Asn)/glutamyl-tRNA(Gln) amidotransferase subunit A